MDGEWEPALISNPACEAAAGCGPWKAPMIDNPAYKGKWRAPLIANPAYKGKWAPRRIANPAYFLRLGAVQDDLDREFRLPGVGGVMDSIGGFTSGPVDRAEDAVWTMEGGTYLFSTVMYAFVFR